MSESTDDLEHTLMLAAAAADSRQEEAEESGEQEESNGKVTELDHVPVYKDTYNSSPLPSQTAKRKSEEVQQERAKKLHTQSIDNEVQRGVKRKQESDDESPNKSLHTENQSSHSKVVATHYNLIEEKGLEERSKSRIVYMRNFHNWIKSMLINEYLNKIRDSKKQHNPPIRVHDMCCGKGGDLSKWKKGNITHLTCSDIAEVSLEHCKQRYADMKQRTQNERGRNGGQLFTMEVVHGDIGKVRLREKYQDPSIKFDLVSCQFAFHYSFESLAQAEVMMKNASECLQPGGFFIGTMPDANEIIARSRKSGHKSFGNKIFKVTLDFDPDSPPLFGGRYNFQLDGVVNCPEFLVHFPTFVKLAKKYGLKFVKKEKFSEFFERMKHEGKHLLSNMRALESFPPGEGAQLAGDAPDDYVHTQRCLPQGSNQKIGTLSKSEWEASSIYLTFAFEKAKNTWNADGTPCYDI